MVDYKQILRLRAEGVSQRGIADVLGCSRNTVAAVFAAANAAGVGFGEVADLGADEVRHLLLPEPAKAVSGRVTPDFEHVHRELARPSVTLLLLWNEYVAGCRAAGGVPYRYSFFNEQYRRWVASTGASMHVQRSPGESIEVDWAGDAMPVADPLTGARVDAWLFVAALSFSAYAYVEAFTDMTLGSWIDAHVHAFEAFGGTARLLVPDNDLASAVPVAGQAPCSSPGACSGPAAVQGLEADLRRIGRAGLDGDRLELPGGGQHLGIAPAQLAGRRARRLAQAEFARPVALAGVAGSTGATKTAADTVPCRRPPPRCPGYHRDTGAAVRSAAGRLRMRLARLHPGWIACRRSCAVRLRGRRARPPAAFRGWRRVAVSVASSPPAR